MSLRCIIVLFLYVLHEDVPNCYDVADATCQDEEVEDGVHEPFLVDAVEYGTRDVAYALGDDPDDGGWRY